MKNVIRKIIPRRLAEPIRDKMFIRNLKKQIQNVRNEYDYCIFFIATPSHGNLGDQAIVYAQQCFLTDQGLGKQIIEVTSFQYQRNSLNIKHFLNDKDVIIIDGGGNMGTLWLHEEHKMQHIVQTFPENPIFIFPQTIFYTSDSKGRKEMQQSVEIYSSHSNLHICAREQESFNFMKKIYSNIDILLIPDIVLYLKKITKQKTRSGVAFCFRTDKEKILSDERIEHLIEEIAQRDLSISYEDTLISRGVTKKNRVNELNLKLSKFSSAELVITDRLHGMIFAAITGTPCIAFDNSSKKVGNVYRWIENLDYIFFVENDKELPQLIDKLLSDEGKEYDNTTLMPYYKSLYLSIEDSRNKKNEA